ncbi:hypothetical protein [Sulfitobacter sp.]|uniref:hypothetical protein n=1 Tax=Sulfitobacter sp. TaxID=1903071 RepID=UPI0032969B61
MTEPATRLIKRFGQEATLLRKGAVSGPPYDPVYGPDLEFPVIVAVTEYTAEERTNSLISDTALRVFMTAGVEPTNADKILIGGTTYMIHRVGVLGPDGVVICYELRVSR